MIEILGKIYIKNLYTRDSCKDSIPSINDYHSLNFATYQYYIIMANFGPSPWSLGIFIYKANTICKTYLKIMQYINTNHFSVNNSMTICYFINI